MLITLCVFLESFEERKIRQSRFQEKVRRKIDFQEPFIPILNDFRCPGGGESQKNFFFKALSQLLQSGGLFFEFGDLFGR